MLRNIQIKIVLIFLILGIIVISAMGYINYINLQNISTEILENFQNYSSIIQKYQLQIINLTIFTDVVFIAICVLVRSICNAKSNFTN